MAGGSSTLLICCETLKRPLSRLLGERGWFDMTLDPLPAALHNTPHLIADAVRERIRRARGRYERILVLYGDCGTAGALDQVLAEEGVERIGGSNCYAIYQGEAEYAARIRAEPGVFFVTDYMVRHFEALIIKGLRLNRHPKLKALYFGKCTRLVHLAQAPDPDLEEKAQAVAAELGLEFEYRHVGFGGYERFLAARAGDDGDDGDAAPWACGEACRKGGGLPSRGVSLGSPPGRCDDG